jgi:hypothetical protein
VKTLNFSLPYTAGCGRLRRRSGKKSFLGVVPESQTSNRSKRGRWVFAWSNPIDPGVARAKLLGVVPESQMSNRNSYSAAVFPFPSDGGGGLARGHLRLHVLWSLPEGHQRYLFEEVHKLCRNHLRSQRVPPSEMTPEELVSEVWQKLLGTVRLLNDEAPDSFPVNPADWSVDPHIPERDGRVVWLVEEIGGSEALAHRCEDILRQRYGRSLPGRGRRFLQLSCEDEIDPDPSGTKPLEETDIRYVWRGLLATAALVFPPSDDVSMLLRLMAEDPDILGDSSNGRWPVRLLVALLNSRFPPPTWNGDRVDNAKRRLINWISRLMRKNRLDATDLEALFAKVTHQQESGVREIKIESLLLTS